MLRMLYPCWQLKAEHEARRFRELENQLRLQTERTEELQRKLASVRILRCFLVIELLGIPEHLVTVTTLQIFC